MLRRATLTALLTLCMASGAMAAEGQVIKLVTMGFDGNVDTANHIAGDEATKVDDSLTFYTKEFSVGIPWTQATIRVLVADPDTVFEDDTLGFVLETKTDHVMDSAWRTLATFTKLKEATLNTNTLGWLRAYNDADTTAGNWYRIRVEYVVEQDTIRAHDQAGVLPLNAEYQFLAIFRTKGNE